MSALEMYHEKALYKFTLLYFTLQYCVCVGMKSAQVASDAEHYLPMISIDDSSQHQREAAAHSNSRHGHRRHTDFRMIPNEADCQVTANSVIIFFIHQTKHLIEV